VTTSDAQRTSVLVRKPDLLMLPSRTAIGSRSKFRSNINALDVNPEYFGDYITRFFERSTIFRAEIT
jgi:hypothetical protein